MHCSLSDRTCISSQYVAQHMSAFMPTQMSAYVPIEHMLAYTLCRGYFDLKVLHVGIEHMLKYGSICTAISYSGHSLIFF